MKKLYKLMSFILMITFTIVGLLFLIMPGGVLVFFNNISRHLGMVLSPVQGAGFYNILAVGYMYLVTLLAYFMYRYPENRYFPLLLVNGKLASSILSLYLFLLHQPYLIYIVNSLIDGLIGFVVLGFYLKLKETA